MSDQEGIFHLSTAKQEVIKQLLHSGRREVPDFCEKGVNEVLYIPVNNGEIRVFHHVPDKIEFKRPILFMPGYIAKPETWVDFHKPHHGLCEYYYLESREKASSKMRNRMKVKLTIKESANDLVKAIEYLELNKRDYLLIATSYGGGIVFQALIDKQIDSPTIVVFDPIAQWVYTKKFTNFINMITPPFILGILRNLIAKIYLAKMENQAQKKRFIAFAKGTDAWKFRKCTNQNKKFDIRDKLVEISNEIAIFHGPLDKYHPREAYYNFAKAIPKGRFFFMDTADENRELLAGIVGTEYARITKEEGTPKVLKQFEVKIHK
ncbi:MAG: hypothetical protein JXA54_07265 [Candidatus Heimdallarchaeota archaeon]|nr:hypothetical protein [Candidatus Heimdallarchaeota archaeon]